MGLAGVLAVMWRRKLVVLVVTAIVVAIAGWSLSTQEIVYESNADVALLPEPSNPELVPFYGQAVDNLVPTYAQIVESRSFLGGVADDLPFEISDADLDRRSRAQALAGVGVLKIIGSSRSAERAQQIAQATAEALVVRLAGNGVVDVELLDDARLPLSPSSPEPKLVYAVAALFGLLLGGLAAIGWDRWFVRIRSVADLEAASGVEVLAVLPEERRLRERKIVVGDPQLTDLDESLRNLRTNMFFRASDLSKGSTVITGISPGDGKSTVAANLAVLTAEMGLSVVLVDADVHRPVQHELFDLPNDVGLTSAVLDGTPVDQMPRSTKIPNLRVITAGPALSNRAQELRVYLDVLPRCSTLAEVVLVDSPPIAAADEVRVLAGFSAQVLLLVRSGSVTARQVQQTIESLRVVDARLLGVVLSRSKQRDAPQSISYYRSYRREPGEETEGAGPSDPTPSRH